MISIVTPGLGQIDWLELCCASVNDQGGASFEHLVQYGGDPEDLTHLRRKFPATQFHVEADQGMYDAVNRGLAKCRGDILAYLNSDEQYLPGALAAVEKFFAAHPKVEVLFGDVVVVDSSGDYVCSRQVLPPRLYHTWTRNLSTLSCAMFFRRSLLSTPDGYFPAQWRSAGDAAWMVRLLQRPVQMAVIRQYLAVFTETGDNLGLTGSAQEESVRLFQSAPPWVQSLSWYWTLFHRLRRWRAGLYRVRPFSFAIYRQSHPGQRIFSEVCRPTFLWKNRCFAGR